MIASLALHGEGFEPVLYKNEFHLDGEHPEAKLSVGGQRGNSKRLCAIVFLTADAGRSAIGSLHYVTAEHDVGTERRYTVESTPADARGSTRKWSSAEHGRLRSTAPSAGFLARICTPHSMAPVASSALLSHGRRCSTDGRCKDDQG